MPLSRDQIVDAAIRVLDDEGQDALSMRRLGAELGSGATSVCARQREGRAPRPRGRPRHRRGPGRAEAGDRVAGLDGGLRPIDAPRAPRQPGGRAGGRASGGRRTQRQARARGAAAAPRGRRLRPGVIAARVDDARRLDDDPRAGGGSRGIRGAPVASRHDVPGRDAAGRRGAPRRRHRADRGRGQLGRGSRCCSRGSPRARRGAVDGEGGPDARAGRGTGGAVRPRCGPRGGTRHGSGPRTWTADVEGRGDVRAGDPQQRGVGDGAGAAGEEARGGVGHVWRTSTGCLGSPTLAGCPRRRHPSRPLQTTQDPTAPHHAGAGQRPSARPGIRCPAMTSPDPRPPPPRPRRARRHRDVGGYPAAGGRRTRWRTLLRSDELTPAPIATRDVLEGLRPAPGHRPALARGAPGLAQHLRRERRARPLHEHPAPRRRPDAPCRPRRHVPARARHRVAPSSRTSSGRSSPRTGCPRSSAAPRPARTAPA